ncbi:MAG: hypothetical protein ABIZ69_00885, partial [Ilumatobacteraceae bacterium]
MLNTPFFVAERERVDAGAPREVGRRATEGCDGVGETGSVEMDAQASLTCQRSQLGDLLGRV